MSTITMQLHDLVLLIEDNLRVVGVMRKERDDAWAECEESGVASDKLLAAQDATIMKLREEIDWLRTGPGQEIDQ